MRIELIILFAVRNTFDMFHPVCHNRKSGQYFSGSVRKVPDLRPITSIRCVYNTATCFVHRNTKPTVKQSAIFSAESEKQELNLQCLPRGERFYRPPQHNRQLPFSVFNFFAAIVSSFVQYVFVLPVGLFCFWGYFGGLVGWRLVPRATPSPVWSLGPGLAALSVPDPILI